MLRVLDSEHMKMLLASCLFTDHLSRISYHCTCGQCVQLLVKMKGEFMSHLCLFSRLNMHLRQYSTQMEVFGILYKETTLVAATLINICLLTTLDTEN